MTDNQLMISFYPIIVGIVDLYHFYHIKERKWKNIGDSQGLPENKIIIVWIA